MGKDRPQGNILSTKGQFSPLDARILLLQKVQEVLVAADGPPGLRGAIGEQSRKDATGDHNEGYAVFHGLLDDFPSGLVGMECH